jgi:hypothetical protein
MILKIVNHFPIPCCKGQEHINEIHAGTGSHIMIVVGVSLVPIILYVIMNKLKGGVMEADSILYRFNS